MSSATLTATDWRSELGWSEAQWDALVMDCDKYFRQGGGLSMWELADRHGVTIQQFMRVARSHGLLEAVQERRNSLSDDSLMLASAAKDLVVDHLSDPLKREKIAAREAGTLFKQMVDTSITLRDGRAAPTTTFNISDMKAVIQLSARMSDKFEPVAVEQKEEAK